VLLFWFNPVEAEESHTVSVSWPNGFDLKKPESDLLIRRLPHLDHTFVPLIREVQDAKIAIRFHRSIFLWSTQVNNKKIAPKLEYNLYGKGFATLTRMGESSRPAVMAAVRKSGGILHVLLHMISQP
jgi:hypothetical protein